MRQLNIGVHAEVGGHDTAMLQRLSRLGFDARVVSASEIRSGAVGAVKVDLVVYICCGCCPNSLYNLSGFAYNPFFTDQRGALPVVLVRGGTMYHSYYLRGSLAEDCPDNEIVQAIQEAYDMIPHGDVLA